MACVTIFLLVTRRRLSHMRRSRDAGPPAALRTAVFTALVFVFLYRRS